MDKFNWQHISYTDGSNPYICTNEREFHRMQKKYGDYMKQIKPSFWMVTVKED